MHLFVGQNSLYKEYVPLSSPYLYFPAEVFSEFSNQLEVSLILLFMTAFFKQGYSD